MGQRSSDIDCVFAGYTTRGLCHRLAYAAKRAIARCAAWANAGPTSSLSRYFAIPTM